MRRHEHPELACFAGALTLIASLALAGCSDSDSADAVDGTVGTTPEGQSSALVWGRDAWGEKDWNDQL